MSSEPRAFAAVDRGTATVAVSLVGRVGGHWRLLGATAAPVAVADRALLERLRTRLVAADTELAEVVGLQAAGSTDGIPRVACRTSVPPELAVLATTERALTPIAAAVAGAGWRVHAIAIEGADILDIASVLASPRVSAVLAGAGDPPGADERSLLGELAALVTAATERRPELTLVLAGGLATPGARLEAAIDPRRPGPTLVAPAPVNGGSAALHALLDGLRAEDADGRRALATATGTLARVLGRRVEVVEIGQSAGVRVAADGAPGAVSPIVSAVVAEAALLPRGFSDANLDAITGWLPVPLDRLRVRDRLREMALCPWGDGAGDGALLRVAAARAALEQLAASTRAFDDAPAPDLVVASGGAWAVAPAPVVALALADVMRRPGVRALGWDHARLLAPLGTIEDADERRRVVADLLDELLAPLGSVVMPAGLRPGRSAGRLLVHGRDGGAELELIPGGLELVDLPPGDRAVAELRFRDQVDLGARARHVAVEVTGGLGGLLVDLRDVPLRLPARPERRRELLDAWQESLWAGMDG